MAVVDDINFSVQLWTKLNITKILILVKSEGVEKCCHKIRLVTNLLHTCILGLCICRNNHFVQQLCFTFLLNRYTGEIKGADFVVYFKIKITRRTTGAKGNKFLQVIASFRLKDSDSNSLIASNKEQ